jgi:flagellar hook-length control protein FliK
VPATPATPPASPIVAAAAQAVAVPSPLRETRRTDDGATIDTGSTTPLPFASAPPVAPSGHVAPAGQPVSVQQVVLQQHLDLAHDGAWLDNLARDIANSADSDSRLSFRLNPAHLGSLHVELSNGADGTSIRFTAETEAARAILVDSRHHLVAEARAQGVRVAETQIDVAGSGGQGANLGGGQHQQGGSQARMSGPQQNLLTILPQTRPVADVGASSASVRERYA